MKAKLPLQVVLLRHSLDLEAAPFEEAVESAFTGSPMGKAYHASGKDLSVEIRKFYAVPAVTDIESLLNSVCHTLVVTIIDNEALKDTGFLKWIENSYKLIKASNGRHRFILLALEERVGDKLRGLCPDLATSQSMIPQDFGERAIRAVMFSLRVLHEARASLAAAIDSVNTPGFLRLFISHAKLDGLPLAKSLKHLIEEISWMNSFYDARDLFGSTDWQQALKEAAISSLLVILRTDAYEQRPWCRQEVLWAEEYGAPAVLVEARPGLVYPEGDLPLERMPSVRISDGNIFRILNAAIRENLRYLLFQRRVHEMKRVGDFGGDVNLKIFSYPPSMTALLRTCQDLNAAPSAASIPKVIFYPDPPLRTGLYEAAMALVAVKAPGVQLLTPDALAVKGGIL